MTCKIVVCRKKKKTPIMKRDNYNTKTNISRKQLQNAVHILNSPWCITNSLIVLLFKEWFWRKESLQRDPIVMPKQTTFTIIKTILSFTYPTNYRSLQKFEPCFSIAQSPSHLRQKGSVHLTSQPYPLSQIKAKHDTS
jgi:hypothetical protein